MTTAPRAKVRNISGTINRSYAFTPRRFTSAAAHRNASEIASRTPPDSSVEAAPDHCSATAMSRRNGVITYDTTPIATHSENHCENEAMNPR